MLPIKVVRVSNRIAVQVGKQGLPGPPGPPDETTAGGLAALILALEQGTGLARLVKDSNDQYALAVKNLTTGGWEPVAAVQVEGQPALTFTSLP
jgi:hypothetical protein